MSTKRKRNYKGELIKVRVQNEQKNKYNIELNDLPVEVLCKIFDYINFKDVQSISRTCKRFYEITKSQQFVSKATLKFKNLLLMDDESVIERYTTSDKIYKHLFIQTCRIGELEKFFEKFGKHISTLVLDDLSLCERELIYILSNLPNLQSLEISYVYFHYLTVNKSTRTITNEIVDKLNFLNNNLPKLKKLSLLRSCNIEIILSTIFPLTRNLLELSMSDCQIDNLRSYYNAYEKRRNTQNIVKLIDQLSLTLEELIIDLDCLSYERINYEKLLNLNLKKFITCPHYDIDQGKFSFIMTQTNLIRLDLAYLYHMEESMINIICEKLTLLESINLCGTKGITDSCLKNLSKLKHLKEIDVSNCSVITSSGILSGIATERNEKFRVLKMSRVETNIQYILSIAKNLPNLRVLDLSYCRNGLRNASIQAIFKNCKMLTDLNISGSDWITNSGITGITQKQIKSRPSINNLRGLRRLDISDCRRITCEAWEFLELPELHFINVSHPLYFSVDSIKVLLTKCPSIEKLIAKGLNNRHATAIWEFSKRLRYLASFEFEKWGGRSMTSRYCGYNCCVEKRTKRKRTQTIFYGIENK